MKRRVLNLLTAGSLLLCVATAVLWVRSYWRYDSVAVVDNTVERDGDHGVLWRSYAASSDRGKLRLTVEDHEIRIRSDEPWPPPRPGWELRRFAGNLAPRLDLTHGRGWMGISSGSNFGMGSGGSSHERYLTVPHAAVAFAAAVLATPLVKRRARRMGRRRVASNCLSCGYDLRATPGRCPECGATVQLGNVSAPG
jgi:hypothetical protein